VCSDIFGFFEDFKPKFVKQYLDGGKLIRDALSTYVDEVKSRKFPSENYTY
jgi:3-methyl-2-oxobutanoate hydroxymethyltransferase